MPTPNRFGSRSALPDPRCSSCLLRQARFSPNQHARISAEAGISVGLIYRYFENKEAVISAMADRHKREISEILQRAKQAATLSSHSKSCSPPIAVKRRRPVVSAFVVDLYAEASRNPRVADLVRDVLQTAMAGVTELISRAPEAQNTTRGLSPIELAELIFAVARGMLMLDVLRPQEMTATERRERQLQVTRRLWSCLFKPEAELAYA